MKPSSPLSKLSRLCAGALVLTLASHAGAASYASGVTISGTSVNFVLNEPADILEVIINGGAPQTLNGTTAGAKSFSLATATDTFQIRVKDSAAVGYTIPTGGTVAVVANGLSQPTAQAGFNQITDDTNALLRFNSPRGVAVSTDPNAPNFGTAYVSNTATGTVAVNGALPARDMSAGDGIFAIGAAFNDVLGGGNTAKSGGLNFTTSASSPFRIQVASNGDLYLSDFSDTAGGVSKMNPTLTAGTQVLAGVGGPSALPVGQNHGSTTAVKAIITSSGLTLYTVDEDLTTAQVTGTGSTADKNSLWKYNIGGSATPYSGMPEKIASVLVPGATTDMDVGADGKFYLAQNRAAGAESGLVVTDPGGNVLWDSLVESRAMLGNATAADILRNVLGMAVSPDQKWAAIVLNNSDVAVVPLVNGLPDLAKRMVVDTGTDINSGRDIAFDAAGNIHYVSSGQGLYRVLAPGGGSEFVTSWNGSSFSFSAVPEPAGLTLLGLAALPLLRRRRK